MKRIAAALLCLLLLTGCSSAGPAGGTTAAKEDSEAAGSVQSTKMILVPPPQSDAEYAASVCLHHAGGTYEPTLRMVYSFRDGVAADAARIQPNEAAENLTAGMWVTLPVTFEYGADLRRSGFTLYRMDENGELLPPGAVKDPGSSIPGDLYWRRLMEDFTVPEEPGRYLCIGEVSFGSDTQYSGSQYVFAFEVPGPGLAAQTTAAQADHHVILHTAAGDFTPNLRPLGSRHGNVAADALPIFPEDAAAALTEEDWVTLPVSFDFGKPVLGQSYQLYTLPKLKALPWQETFEPPEEAGAYLCIARVSFGTEKEYDIIQYIFAFEVGQETDHALYGSRGTQDHWVILHAGDGDHRPALQVQYENRNGTAVFSEELLPADAAAALTEDMWVTLPVEFEFGEMPREQYWTVYALPEVQKAEYTAPAEAWNMSPDFRPPQKAGQYLCVVNIEFGTRTAYTCYQYAFAFEVP